MIEIQRYLNNNFIQNTPSPFSTQKECCSLKTVNSCAEATFSDIHINSSYLPKVELSSSELEKYSKKSLLNDIKLPALNGLENREIGDISAEGHPEDLNEGGVIGLYIHKHVAKSAKDKKQDSVIVQVSNTEYFISSLIPFLNKLEFLSKKNKDYSD